MQTADHKDNEVKTRAVTLRGSLRKRQKEKKMGRDWINRIH